MCSSMFVCLTAVQSLKQLLVTTWCDCSVIDFTIGLCQMCSATWHTGKWNHMTGALQGCLLTHMKFYTGYLFIRAWPFTHPMRQWPSMWTHPSSMPRPSYVYKSVKQMVHLHEHKVIIKKNMWWAHVCMSVAGPAFLCRWSSGSSRRRWCAGTFSCPAGGDIYVYLFIYSFIYWCIY